MSIDVTTSPGATATSIIRDYGGTLVQHMSGLTLDEVRHLHAELGKVIELADTPAAPWTKKPRRQLKTPKE